MQPRVLAAMVLAPSAAVPEPVEAPDEAAAQPASVEGRSVRWSAPPGCPSGEQVDREVEELLGKTSSPSSISVQGNVTVAPEGYRLDLRIEAGRIVEDRVLQSGDCTLLGSAAALLVAITVDAVATAKTVGETVHQPTRQTEVRPLPEPIEAPAPLPTMTPESEAAAVPPKQDRPRRSSPRRDRWRHGAELMAGGGFGAGLAADITGGVEGWVGWRVGPLRVRAGGYHWFSRPRALDSRGGVRAALSGAGLRGCYALEGARFEVPFCAGLDLAALHGEGTGQAVSAQPASDLWVAIAAGSGIEFRVSKRFALHAKAEASIAVRQPAFHLQAADAIVEVFRSPPAALRVVLGPGVVF